MSTEVESSFNMIHELNSSKSDWVRVSRLWYIKNIRDKGSLMSLDIVLVDEEGEYVRAIIKGCFIQTFPSKIAEGALYTFKKIAIVPNKETYHVVSDSKILLEFFSNTTIRALAQDDSKIWKPLDLAELKHSSISSIDIEHHETAISRWSRAKTKAAKVGKGLSKNGKAQKLALQHWQEAIDPLHRYGHNLHFYYVKWLESQSREPFFYWLDIGEGKEVNLVEKCSRLKLQQQCIKYLGPMERKAYEVIVKDGKLFYKESGELLDTSPEPHAKWIFVLSTSKMLYVGKKKKGTFQHSSFMAGGATSAAGRLVVENGILTVIWPHSGHYKPTAENFQDFISFLREYNVDLTDVKTDPVDEDEHSFGKQSSSLLRNNSEVDLVTESVENALGKTENVVEVKTEVLKQETTNVQDHPSSSHSHKETKAYQLEKQLSCKWITGAGPQIGCVRDYPSEVQFRALQQVSLSPTSGGGQKKSWFSRGYVTGSSPKALTPKPIMSQRSIG